MYLTLLTFQCQFRKNTFLTFHRQVHAIFFIDTTALIALREKWPLACHHSSCFAANLSVNLSTADNVEEFTQVFLNYEL